MVSRVFLIGGYPPPYGGVTVKCRLFEKFMQDHGYTVEAIDIYGIKRNKRDLFPVLRSCAQAFRSGKPVVYCIDSKRLKALLRLQSFFAKSFKNTTVLCVGGRFHHIVEESAFLNRTMRKVRGIWVETAGMKEAMEQNGFDNVLVFPNPKSEDGACPPQKNDREPIKLVFFSLISEKKGIRDVMAMIPLLEERHIPYQLELFGQIVPGMKEEFESFVSSTPNVSYEGVFDSTKSSVYAKLNEYDVLLLPTHWRGEGVPGILVEAKMSGLAVLAGDINFNSEIIRENEAEGFLLKKDYPLEMAETVARLDKDRELLYRIKQGSYASRERYALEKYAGLLETIAPGDRP